MHQAENSNDKDREQKQVDQVPSNRKQERSNRPERKQDQNDGFEQMARP
jgi:hypothetical protein